MGVRFREASGVEPFSVDQLATVALADGVHPRIELTADLEQILQRFGGTAGFINDSPAEGFEGSPWYDATVLSTDNRMVGEVAPTMDNAVLR